MYKYLLFDLDGTLCDTSCGVLRSVQYALGKMELPVPETDALRCFIGPPLVEIFAEFCGFSLEEAKRATAIYRERYSVQGVKEAEPYAGIPELLAELEAAGVTMAVATGKPAPYSPEILESHGLLRYFKTISTPEMDGRHSDKKELITIALEALGVTPAEYGQVAMIGDRHFDIIGAHEVGVTAIGVNYGFAPAGELESVGADIIADTVADLRAILFGGKA